MHIITKNTKIKEAEEILDIHGIKKPKGWEIAMGMLLSECDHLEVHGFGTKAYFTKVTQ